jgi:hypothetical protein
VETIPESIPYRREPTWRRKRTLEPLTEKPGEGTNRGKETACPCIGVDALVIRGSHVDGVYSKISE